MRHFFRQPHALRRNGFQNFLHWHVFVQNFRINQAGGDAVDRNLAFGQLNNFNANTYVRMMPHTTAANVAIFFGLTGRLIPTSSACTSGSQGIGYAYEAIKYGKSP